MRTLFFHIQRKELVDGAPRPVWITRQKIMEFLQVLAVDHMTQAAEVGFIEKEDLQIAQCFTPCSGAQSLGSQFP